MSVRSPPRRLARLAVRFARAWVIGCLVFAFGAPAIAAEKARHVLVLYGNNRLLPANVELDAGLHETFAKADPYAELSAEFLDYPRFEGEAYVHTIITFLREKYA